jgi:hypothetical protein
VVGDTAEDIGELSLGIDTIEFGGFNQGEGDCHGFAATLKIGELSYSQIVGQYFAKFKLLFAFVDQVLMFQFCANKPQQVVCRQGQNAAFLPQSELPKSRVVAAWLHIPN